ncbi:MAG TPA: N-acetyltransferase [Thermoanaerobaculia bacterium]|nr:N-acetyltransferase [Thermoanaerobaculia bacterium]
MLEPEERRLPLSGSAREGRAVLVVINSTNGRFSPSNDLNCTTITVRTETPSDAAAIRRVNELAFGRTNEAELVDALRREADPYVSLVAEDRGEVVGHIAFTPVMVELAAGGVVTIAGLAPMAVLPARQREGIGSMLVVAGLQECRRAGFAAVVVLGHPEYYPRFGFVPAARTGLTSKYDVPEPAFMIAELVEHSIAALRGVARYHQAFNTV